MNSLANTLLDSRRAARCVGPNRRSPSAANTSATPRLSGNSGPMIVKSISSRRAIAATAWGSAGSTGMHRATRLIPAFPGAHTMSDTERSDANFHTSACSRPPLPMTRTLVEPTFFAVNSWI